MTGGTRKRARGHFRLDALDMSVSMSSRTYDARAIKLATKLQRIQQAYLHTGNNAIIVFEGWDAGGKGGTIRRMSSVLDPRGFKVWPIGPPNEHDSVHHYLTRFWERLPPRGGISVFDRSWYGRVLVERVEGFADKAEWSRAYDEINEFEKLLTDDGMQVIKLFLHITPEEQLKRFKARLKEPLKRWKLTYEDFRNRANWADYERAIEDMVNRTSTKNAPWHVVPANDKKFARIQCVGTIVKTLSKGVDLSPRPIDDRVRQEARELFGLEFDKAPD